MSFVVARVLLYVRSVGNAGHLLIRNFASFVERKPYTTPFMWLGP